MWVNPYWSGKVFESMIAIGYLVKSGEICDINNKISVIPYPILNF